MIAMSLLLVVAVVDDDGDHVGRRIVGPVAENVAAAGTGRSDNPSR